MCVPAGAPATCCCLHHPPVVLRTQAGVVPVRPQNLSAPGAPGIGTIAAQSTSGNAPPEAWLANGASAVRIPGSGRQGRRGRWQIRPLNCGSERQAGIHGMAAAVDDACLGKYRWISPIHIRLSGSLSVTRSVRRNPSQHRQGPRRDARSRPGSALRPAAPPGPRRARNPARRHPHAVWLERSARPASSDRGIPTMNTGASSAHTALHARRTSRAQDAMSRSTQAVSRSRSNVVSRFSIALAASK